MFDKQEILNSRDGEIRESFQKLIIEVLSILPKYIQNKGYVPTSKILTVLPSSNGYSEKSHTAYELMSLVIRDMNSLKAYEHCFQIVSDNELLRLQDCSYLVVLSSFIRDYLEEVNPETIIFDQKKFDSIFEKYIDKLLSRDYESISICPLIGFESDIDKIMLDEGLAIRKITSNELNEIWSFISAFDLESIGFKRKLVVNM